jgi:hypothetical protein
MPLLMSFEGGVPRGLTEFLILAALLSLSATAPQAWSGDIPRTEDGHPNFEGVWYYGSATPLERPKELGLKKTYSNSEAERLIADLQQFDVERLMPSDPNRIAPDAGAEIGQEADANFITTRINLTNIDGVYRTSLIVEPPDGRFPFRNGGRDVFDNWRAAGIGDFDNPEMRTASDRCLSVAGPMPPMVGWRYNANMRIVQTPDYIVLNGEMQGPRFLALNGQQRPLGLPHWLGESIATWKGDTLVVETDNFRPESSWFTFKHSDQLLVSEVFELINGNEIEYRYTVTDPVIYTEPITVEMSISRRPADERLYEFACHEGNYSLGGMLRGARKEEQDSANP